MADDIVRYERSGAVALITLNRPDALNAITLAMRGEIAAAFQRAEADAEVRAIILRGAGERAFCAGADVSEFKAAESLAEVRAGRHGTIWNDVIAGCRKPTLAAIHGYCLGGGLETALACDVRIASDDAAFALPEVRHAIIPGAGGTQRLPRVVGVGNALRLILTGDRIDAHEALRIGLVSEVVPKADLGARALEWAARLSLGGPLAIAYAKEAVRRGSELPLGDGLKLEADLATLLTNTKDRLEGAAAFKERRKPEYRGE